jgi:hypothetical protein
LVPLTGCTDDSGSPAAELRSIDRSSAVRDRVVGDGAGDREEPDASEPDSAANRKAASP